MNQRISKRFNKRVTKEEVLASSTVLEAIKQILVEDLDSSIKESTKTDNYKLPSWGEYQADQLGSQRTYRKIIDLITIKGNING